ncbi:hypothetical protein WA026_014589 [Henosepilachna vigintioctopunctata]|uniref:Mitochondrial pyruvate carrier n=1 Tax=Henosepilachna vigintioctopunctata TaxID=420089 RepID=A0AAW1V7R4_9CUCU
MDMEVADYGTVTPNEPKTFWKKSQGTLQNAWNHPAGPKTIFFWAPLFKWGLVLAGITDLWRPAATLSLLQTLSLAATGLIWSRYSMVIIPKNYYLFSVNVFIAITQCYQFYRVIRFEYFTDKSAKS